MTRPLSNAALILSVVFAPTMAQAAWRDEVVRTEQRTTSVPFGGSVRIDHRTGHVKVRGHQRDDLLVEATFRVSANTKANAEAFLRAMQLDVTTAGTTVIVRVNTPQSNSGNNNVGFAVDLDVSVPERIRLTIENRFGDTTVTRVKTPLTISGSNGKILVSDIEAPATLRSRFGGIDAESGDRRPQDPEQQRRHRGARRPGRRHDHDGLRRRDAGARHRCGLGDRRERRHPAHRSERADQRLVTLRQGRPPRHRGETDGEQQQRRHRRRHGARGLPRRIARVAVRPRARAHRRRRVRASMPARGTVASTRTYRF